jgi:Dna[CI] antecedent DciA-like protein
VDRLGKVLPRVLARQRHAGILAEYRLRQAFREVLGEALAAACETIEVRGTTVSVTTANPALAHQLRLDAEELMRRLNAEARLTRQVRVIRVRIGRGPGAGPER